MRRQTLKSTQIVYPSRMLDVLSESLKVINGAINLIPDFKRSHFRKKFYKLEKKIRKEMDKEDHERIDSLLDDYRDDYILLLKHFGQEVERKRLP